MADLKDKLSQHGDVIVYTQAWQYLTALNTKLNEAVGTTITCKKSYLSKYEVVDDLRQQLGDDWRTKKFPKSSISDADFETIKPLLDTTKDILDIVNESEENYNKLASYLNDLADNHKDAFDPPLAESFEVNGSTVYPIPQSQELDPRRFARTLQFDIFEQSTLKWLISNAPLYGFLLYENYALYFLGLTEVKKVVQSDGIQKVVNRFQKEPIPAGSIKLTASEVASAKDPIFGELDPATLSGTAKDNDGKIYGPGGLPLVYVPGLQLMPPAVAAAAIQLINAAKLEAGLSIRVNSGFRPAVDEGSTITWTTPKGKNGKLTTQLALRRDSSRFVKSHADYKKYVGSNGSGNGKYGAKSGLEAFIYYAGSSAYNAATAPPGASNHGGAAGIGPIACDFNTGGRKNFSPLQTNNYVWLIKNAHRFGFVRGVRSEEWHFEYRPDIAPRGPYAMFGPNSTPAGKLAQHGFYTDLGLDNITV